VLRCEDGIILPGLAVAEFFIDNPFISVTTSLSVSRFWNPGLTQVASITGAVGVSFIVTLFASIVNYIREEGLRKDTVVNVIGYGLIVAIMTSVGMMNIEMITTTDQTVRVATSVENFNLLLEDQSVLAQYEGTDEERMFQANVDIIAERAKQAVLNEATLLVFPEDAFVCPSLPVKRLSARCRRSQRRTASISCCRCSAALF